MTRGNARELAIHLIYGREFTGDTPIETVRLRLEEGYYEQLAAEYEIYTERPVKFRFIGLLERRGGVSSPAKRDGEPVPYDESVR